MPRTGSKGRLRSAWRTWAVSLALSLLSFAAGAAAPSPRPSADQTARIAHACAVTMGFAQGTVQYADCVASLSNSVANLRPAHGVADGRPECADRASGNPSCAPERH
jgi:hypothetical protein